MSNFYVRPPDEYCRLFTCCVCDHVQDISLFFFLFIFIFIDPLCIKEEKSSFER